MELAQSRKQYSENVEYRHIQDSEEWIMYRPMVQKCWQAPPNFKYIFNSTTYVQRRPSIFFQLHRTTLAYSVCQPVTILYIIWSNSSRNYRISILILYLKVFRGINLFIIITKWRQVCDPLYIFMRLLCFTSAQYFAKIFACF